MEPGRRKPLVFTRNNYRKGRRLPCRCHATHFARVANLSCPRTQHAGTVSEGPVCPASSRSRLSRRGRKGKQVDRKSTRLNSSHEWISYAVFCLKKKNNID